ADRRASTRTGVRKPRLPPRRGWPHSATVRRQALDRVPAAVPRLAPGAADATGPLHRALLPRRGDGVRCRAPTLRTLPPAGLRALLRDLARPSPGRQRRRRDRRAAPRP